MKEIASMQHNGGGKLAAVAMVLVAVLFVAMPRPSHPQSLGLPHPTPAASTEPYGFPVTRVRDLQTAPVTFAGERLFVVAAHAAHASDLVPPVVQRVETIKDNLRRIVPDPTGQGAFEVAQPRFDADSFVVGVGNENGYPTLYGTDKKRTSVVPIMTVTEADATLNDLPSKEVAARWRDVLQSSLGRAIRASEPTYVRLQLRRALYAALGAIVATLCLGILRTRLKKRRRELRREDALRDSAGPPRSVMLTTAMVSGPWILTGLMLALWLIVLVWTLEILPGTRAYATEISTRVTRVVILWFGIAVLSRILSIVIFHVTKELEYHTFVAEGESSRARFRRPTIIHALENLKGVVLYAFGIGATFSALGISGWSALTIGAIAGFAISFAAQSIIKDYVMGLLILTEDQFALGDYVTINGVSGIVEGLMPRITQIRTDDGKLVTIANGTISLAENATQSWARVDVRLSIALDSDVNQALACLQATLDALAHDPRWSASILEPPVVLGIESLAPGGIVLRAWVKTAPWQRAPVLHEINRRIEEAFRSYNIRFALP